jgi:hypothetical protein
MDVLCGGWYAEAHKKTLMSALIRVQLAALCLKAISVVGIEL